MRSTNAWIAFALACPAPCAALSDPLQVPLGSASWAAVLWGMLAVCLGAALTAPGVCRTMVSPWLNATAGRQDGREREGSGVAWARHDRMLQGFNGVLFLVEAARSSIASHPARAIDLLERALKHGEAEVREGVRASVEAGDDVDPLDGTFEAIAAIGAEFLAADPNSKVKYFVIQEGPVKQLAPQFRDEVYRLVRMAVRNAKVYDRPRLIEVELDLCYRVFRVAIRDDGDGIALPEHEADSRRPSAARVRLDAIEALARECGGRFRAWSGHQAGTEIELVFSGDRAYGARALKFPSWVGQMMCRRWTT